MKKLILLGVLSVGLFFSVMPVSGAPAKSSKASKAPAKPAPETVQKEKLPDFDKPGPEKEIKPRVYHERAFASTFEMLDKIVPDSGVKDSKILKFEDHKLPSGLSMAKLYRHFRCQIFIDPGEQRPVNLFSHSVASILEYKNQKTDHLKPASLEEFKKYMEEGGVLLRAEACYDITVKRFSSELKIRCRNCGGHGKIIKYTFGENSSRECPICAGKGYSVKNHIRREREGQEFKELVYHLVFLEQGSKAAKAEKQAVGNFHFPFKAPVDAPAQFYAGKCYAAGDRTDRDFNKALEWWRKAAGRKDKNALALWHRLAEKGDADAQFILSLCYAGGLGVGRDAAKAGQLLEAAARKGNAWAQFQLAGSYAKKAAGDKKNSREAMQWAGKAAARGLPNAQAYLGGCYLTGTGVKKSIPQAKSWLEKAAAQGHAPAKNMMNMISKGAKDPELKKMAAPLLKI